MYRLLFTSVAAALLAVGGCTPQQQGITVAPPNSGVNLIPKSILAAEKQAPTTAPSNEDEKDLVQAISQSSQEHDQLLRLIRLSGLVPALREKGPFTLFAPTDFALSKLPPGILTDLEKPENQARLRALFSYYLIPGRISFAMLLDTNGEVTTLSGQPLTIRGINRGVMVNDVAVLRTDTSAYNGVIHWIDGPLLPPG